MTVATLPPTIVLFDGVCNLCNGVVRFILRRDPRKTFRFASLQSPVGQQLARDHGIDAANLGTIVLIESDRAYTKSTAALRIARRLAGPVRAMGIFLMIPAAIRDSVYDFVARRRYSWFGRKDACPLPDPALRDRFLDAP